MNPSYIHLTVRHSRYLCVTEDPQPTESKSLNCVQCIFTIMLPITTFGKLFMIIFSN